MSKADDLFFKEFGAVIVALTVFVIAMFFLANSIGGDTFRSIQNSPSTLAARIAPVGSVRLDGEAVPEPVQVATAPAAAAGAGLNGEGAYNAGCNLCHDTGAAGAPKFGEGAVWQTRFEQGLDVLVASVVNGKGGMPAKGANPALSDEEIERAVVYMLEGAGIDAGGGSAAAEPAAPTAEAAPAPAAEATTEMAAAGKPGSEVYQAGCIACHAAGVAGAPKLDDTAAWTTRAAKGEDGLLETVINGKGVMLPRGGNPALSDADLRNAVRYMLEQAGVSG